MPAPGAEPSEDADLDVTVQQLEQWIERGDVTLIDVRTEQEREICTIEGSLHIPVLGLERRLTELDPKQRIVVHCHRGPRSTRATNLLRGAGFERAFNLQGGIDRWADEIDPTLPRY